jgi:endonuclease IV
MRVMVHASYLINIGRSSTWHVSLADLCRLQQAGHAREVAERTDRRAQALRTARNS